MLPSCHVFLQIVVVLLSITSYWQITKEHFSIWNAPYFSDKKTICDCNNPNSICPTHLLMWSLWTVHPHPIAFVFLAFQHHSPCWCCTCWFFGVSWPWLAYISYFPDTSPSLSVLLSPHSVPNQTWQRSPLIFASKITHICRSNVSYLPSK